jgi:hypothetical protein
MALHQGTTSVVPKWAHKTWGFSPCGTFFIDRLSGFMQPALEVLENRRKQASCLAPPRSYLRTRRGWQAAGPELILVLRGDIVYRRWVAQAERGPCGWAKCSQCKPTFRDQPVAVHNLRTKGLPIMEEEGVGRCLGNSAQGEVSISGEHLAEVSAVPGLKGETWATRESPAIRNLPLDPSRTAIFS